MKKLLILSLVVAFSFLGAQAFASPPIKPPVEGFIINTYTEIDCIGDVTESERYDWTYFEGTGMLRPPLGDGTSREINTTLNDLIGILGLDPANLPPWAQALLAHGGDMILLQELGFAEGAQIAYQQDFKAVKGSTYFEKTFQAVSHTNTATPNNLSVEKTINYDDAGDGVIGDGNATHLEKVAMNVVSVGSAGGDPVAAATSLLQLCPWATSHDGSTPGYPPTNEGIAAASEFNVTKINFKSSTTVNTVNNPALFYNVTAEGEGLIKAGFAVDLWEGREGDVWGTTSPHQPWIDQYNRIAEIHGWPTWDHPSIVFVNEGPPDLASRTSYSEHASADGVWKFTKNVSYESVMPGGVAASSIPINTVP